MKTLLEKIRRILRSRRTRQLLTRTVSVTAAIVVFITTYALILPAITLEKTAACGIEEHQHDDSCYKEVLICNLPESKGHHHTDECYKVTKILSCDVPEHQHSEECYDAEGNLICELIEHTHGAGCYEEQKELICGLEESEGHTHDSSCYEKVLICGKQPHIHSTECYKEDSGAVAASGDTAVAVSTAAASVAATDSAADTDDLTGKAAGQSGFNNVKGISENAGSVGTEETSENAGSAADKDDMSTENTHEMDPSTANGSTEEAASAAEGLTEEAASASNGLTEEAASAAEGLTEEAASASNGLTEEAASAATTNVLPEPVKTEDLSEGYVPELDSIDFNAVLNKHTDFYYFHAEKEQDIPGSSKEITDWKQVKNSLFGSTSLESDDLLRMYLSYTIPAGALNETNQIARYRLPANLHLTDEQIIAINETENGMSLQYVNAGAEQTGSTAEETETDENKDSAAEETESDESKDSAAKETDADAEKNEDNISEAAENYRKYLGVEAVEGTRTPDEELKEGTQEYISAIVKAENVYDEEGLYGEKGAYLGQDLIFVFTPYSIEKNQTTYDVNGTPVTAGEKITGWFACDFTLDQIDWVEKDTDLDNSTAEKTAEIVFAEENSEKGIKKISTSLKMMDDSVADTIEGGKADTASTAEIAVPEEDSEEESESKTENQYKSGTLTADGDGYRITLDYTEEAKIPENAFLSVHDITAETDQEAYKECLAQAEQQVAESTEDKTSVDSEASRFFDIEILVKDEETVEGGDSEDTEGTVAENGTDDAEETIDTEGGVDEAPENSDAENGTDEATKTADTESGIDEAPDNSDTENGADEAAEAADIENGSDDVAETVDAENAQDDLTETDNDNTYNNDNVVRKIEPAAPVSVNIQILDVQDAALEEVQQSDPTVLHFAEEGVEKIESSVSQPAAESDEDVLEDDSAVSVDNDDSGANAGSLSESAFDSSEATEISFEAESFSIYGVVYTVDFHYEVNGKMYEFSIPGGGFASFYKIVEVLGISNQGTQSGIEGENAAENSEIEAGNSENTDGNDVHNVVEETGVDDNGANGNDYEESISLNNVEVSEATKKFVADVASVEFSSPELMWVGKVENETTVGELKEANGLEVQYSAELTEEQIAEINSSTVESGDWALISVLPFDTEESLTVTMKNGDQFIVKVTDAQTEGGVLRDSASETASVTVSKEWYDGNNRITDTDLLKELSATVQLVRYREENSVAKVHLCYAGSKNWTEKATVEVPQESNVTVHIKTRDYKEVAAFDEIVTDTEPYALSWSALDSGNDFNVSLNTVGKSDIYLVYRYGDTDVQEFSYVPAQGASVSGPNVDPTFTEEIVRELNSVNNWEATFADLPTEGDVDGMHYIYTYGVREISTTKGYMFSNYGTVGVNESDASSDVPASLPADSITVHNIKVQPGTLKLSKTSDYDGADAAEKTYRIAVKDLDGIYINPDGTESEGTDPVWVEFKDGDEKTWNNIPAGKYVIEEEDASVEGLSWSWAVKDAHGDISKDYTVYVLPGDIPTEATVSNTYSEPVDVSLVKTWDSNVSDDMAWEATFVLEELEYLYDSSYSAEKAHDDADHSNAWKEVVPRTEFTVSNDSGDIPELSNLPRFRTGEDGKTYILMYSVTETGYKVWADADKTKEPVYQWAVGEGYQGDVHFTPEYVEDADEYTNYTIEIINSEKNETENIFIDFDLTKIWAPEGDPALTDDAYAIFQLKRMSHQEFKNMNDPEVDYSRFVTVRIVDAAGREISSCEIEKNAYIKLQAGFKSGIDGVGTVEFENLDGSTGHVLIENGSALPSQALVSSQPFRIDSDATFKCVSGENYLADGIYGVVISDRCDGAPTTDADDEVFNGQNLRFRVDRNTGHIVSYSNGTISDTTSGATPWKLDFQDFPQTKVDTGTVRQTTTVYGYYFEEVESSPNWKASFYQADAAGNKTGVLNGDADNRIYFDDHVIAENKKPHLTIKKYWESLIQSEMPNVVMEIKQVTSDGNNINVNDSSPVYKRVILTAENNFEYDMYNFPVRNGNNGYYAYVPVELGVTACKPGDPGVDADGTITDINQVSYTTLDSTRFETPTYILAKDGDEINYVRIKADSLDRRQVQNFDQGIKQAVVSSGTGTVCVVNNPKKFQPQMDIRKRWHMFTDAGGMTTESDYNGAYFTVMIVQIVKNAEPDSKLYGKEVKRQDYGTEFEWHYTGNNSFHYYDDGHEGNVTIEYHNGTWHVTIKEGTGHDGSNLPLYGYYTDANGIKHLAEYDYTFREVSITSTDGYHWAISDHIQESSQQGSSGHQFFLDNYPDADLKIVKHWPNKPEREGTSAVYFKITDGDGNNVLKDIAEKKRYREHQLNPADLVEYNGEWCLVVKGSVTSTDDWIGYIDHLDLFDFSDTVFGNGDLPAGAMPGKEMSYNVAEVAVVQNGVTVPSSELYIPYYQVTTRGTKGSIRSSATGIQLGMNVQDEDGNWYLQPTIVEVTNNSTTDLEVEKRFYEKESDRKPVQVDPSEMTEWITEDGAAISRIDYVVKVDTYLTATGEDPEGSSETLIEEMSGYLTEGWKTGGSLSGDISGATVFSLSTTAADKRTETSGVYWSSKPNALQGLPSARMVEVAGGNPLVYRYVYTIVEKGVYAGGNEVAAFSPELEYDSNKGVWKLSNIRTKDEYAPFEFTKEWQNSGSSEPADWPDGKQITVTVTRTKNGQDDTGFALKYTITSQNKESTEISADSDSTYPDGPSIPKLQYQEGTRYTYKLENLLKKHGSDEYVYTVKETGTVDGYVNQNPDGVTDKGKIVNKKAVVDITVLKVDDKGDPLESAVFHLQKKEGGTYQNIKSIKEGNVQKYPDVTGIDNASSFTSGTTAVTIGKLPDGKYRLVEDSTKAGYIIVEKEIDFTISDGVLEGIDIEGIVEFTKAGENDNTLALITITNTPGAALPNTGGPGTNMLYLFGIMLTGLAGAGLVMRRRRRNVT